MGVVALLAWPDPNIQRWWWAPLLLDWGTAPGFLHAGISYIVRRRAGKT
jgi:hypothetical protein